MPERIVTNEEVLSIVERHSKPFLNSKTDSVMRKFNRLLKLSGTMERRWRADGERPYDFAKKAVAEALERAELDPEEIDLVLYVGVGRGWIEPGMATFFQKECNLTNATGFDILDACLSWLRALHVAHTFLKSGVYQNILVLNAEFNYEYNDWATRSEQEIAYRFAQMTIGEAATATILSADDDVMDPFFAFKTDPCLHDLCKIPLPHIASYNDSERCPSLEPLVFFAYSAELMTAAETILPRLYWDTPELRERNCDIAFGHSASKIVIDRVAQKIGYKEKTINLYPQIGNVVSASIPTAMAMTLNEGALERGMEMLLIMGSAGFSAGIAHMVY